MVIDADGITVLAGIKDTLKESKTDIILTPHPGELSRLINISVKDIEKQRTDIAQKIARDLKCCISS